MNTLRFDFIGLSNIQLRPNMHYDNTISLNDGSVQQIFQNLRPIIFLVQLINMATGLRGFYRWLAGGWGPGAPPAMTQVASEQKKC